MKRDLLTHFTFMIALFALAIIFNRPFSFESVIPFLVGGILGTLLPDIDHLLYVYLLHPTDTLSQQVASQINNKQIVKTWDTLVATRFQRTDLLFHTASFQIIFLVFTFLVITSSNSILGKGVVLAFALHLVIDEVVDLMEAKNIEAWFLKFPLKFDAKQKKWFLIANAIVVLAFALMI